jgi:Trans-aconitate methyltransferase
VVLSGIVIRVDDAETIEQLAKAGTGSDGEKGAAFYDEAFTTIQEYHTHYTASVYYFAWMVIIDRIRQAKPRSLLEIGCGPGQLARAIGDAFPAIDYVGFDFSPVAIGAASAHSPRIRFEVADALTTDLLAGQYDASPIGTEFREHVEQEMDVLAKLRPGTLFIGTVPNFPYVSHVRHFKMMQGVRR